MKAVYINQTGGTDVLAYGDRPEPEISPGEILLRVRASALNHLDLNLRAGNCRRFPHILGCDMAGEIAQISPDAGTALNLQVGDRVLLDNRVKCGGYNLCEHCAAGNDQWCARQQRIGVDLDGGHAEYVVAPAINAYAIPDAMPFTEAAALPIAAHTAWHCLITQAKLQPWDDVLVQAAGSGVGSMGIQIAKDDGLPRHHHRRQRLETGRSPKARRRRRHQLSRDGQHQRASAGIDRRQRRGCSV